MKSDCEIATLEWLAKQREEMLDKAMGTYKENEIEHKEKKKKWENINSQKEGE